MEYLFKLCVTLCITTFVSAQFTFEIQQHFEFEDALDETQGEFWVWRSQAYDLKTLRLEDTNRTYTIELKLCVDPYLEGLNVTVYIDDIIYSNDGPSDLVYIQINGVNIGNFTTVEEWHSGYEWNVFRNSNRIGPSVVLSKGNYLLHVEVESDKWGVELDRIEINAENQDPMSKLFCGGKLILNSEI